MNLKLKSAAIGALILASTMLSACKQDNAFSGESPSDDLYDLSSAVSTMTLTEGDNLQIVLILNAVPRREFDVDWVVENGQNDFLVSQGTFTFQSGQAFYALNLKVLTDSVVEGSENFVMRFESRSLLNSLSIQMTIADTTTPASLAILESPGFDFGTSLSGTLPYPLHIFTITNSGEGDATAVSLTGLSQPFSILNDGCSGTLGAGDSCSFEIEFGPGSPGVFQQTLSLNYETGASSETLPLTVDGTAVDPLTASSPFNISGMTVWLNARGSTFTGKVSGDFVTLWPDASNQGHDFSENLNPPVFTSTGISNLPSVRFNGGSSTLSAHIDVSEFGTNPAITMFFVAQQTTTVGAMTFLNIGEPSHNGAGFQFALCDCGMGQGMTFYSYTGAPTWSGYHSHTPGLETTAATLWSMVKVYNSGAPGFESYLYKDGTLPAGQNHTSGNISIAPESDLWTLGQQNNMWNYFNGDMGEILVFNRALTDGEREQVEGYLAHRWNLQANLPLGHTYKAAPPAGSPP